MAEHGCGAVVEGRGEDKHRRVRIYILERLVEFSAGDGWKPELVDIQLFLEPGIARNESAARMFFTLPFLLEKAPERGFEFGSRIPFPVRRKKKFGIIDEAFLPGTVMFIVDKDIPVAVFVQALFFCRLQQRIEIVVVRRWRRAGRKKEEKKR
jgi:hypothetical protein